MKELGELNGNEELFWKVIEEYFIVNINNLYSYMVILKVNGEIVLVGSIVFFICLFLLSNF